MLKSIVFVTLFSVCFARAPFPVSTDAKFQSDCLAATNTYRTKHRSQNLVTNQTAVNYAKWRCNLISQKEGLSEGQKGRKRFGENLYWSASSVNNVAACSAAINGWYNEVSKYNYSRPGFSSATGHFTQLVWNSTTSVGCARCSGKGSRGYETYIVCNYSPPGNFQRQFAANVLRPFENWTKIEQSNNTQQATSNHVQQTSLARAPMPDKTDTIFQNDCLSFSNAKRATHRSQALVTDPAAVTYAKARCQNISRSEGLSAGNAGLVGYGESLYWSGSSANIMSGCSTPINGWYNEVSSYNYSSPGFSSATEHFTQLVWNSTTGVGCARCAGKGSQWVETYIVCNYGPPGNVQGQFVANVLKP